MSLTTHEIEMLETHDKKHSQALFDPDNFSGVLSYSRGHVVKLAFSQCGIH